MADVKTIHEIVTQDRLYPADQIVTDMPQSLIDEMRPLGAVQDVVAVKEAAAELEAAPAAEPIKTLSVKKDK